VGRGKGGGVENGWGHGGRSRSCGVGFGGVLAGGKKGCRDDWE